MGNQVFLQRREIKYYNTYDVVVAGGGSAGIGAALAAARNGARTLLVEQNGFLGGNATAGYVLKFHGFKTNGKRVVGGIPYELAKRMKEKGGAVEIGEDVDGFIFDPEIWKYVANEMVLESGVDILFHSFVSDILQKDQDIIKGVIVENKGGPRAIRASKVIDATGTGDVAIKAGAMYQKGRSQDKAMQPMCFCFRMENVQPFILSEIRKMLEKGVLNKEISFFGGPWIDSLDLHSSHKGRVLVNLIRVWQDASDASDLSRAEIEGSRQVFIVVDFLRKNIPAFKDSCLLDTAPSISFREANHVLGEYILTKEDIVSGTRFEDGVAVGVWGIDIHSPIPSSGWKCQGLQDYYLIPYRCLIPQKIENLLLAGGPISTDHEAWASARVMATCMATGQAAGTAAAMSVKQDTPLREIAISQLRKTLEEQDVFLGNTEMS